MGRGALILLACAGAAGAQNSPRGHNAILDKVAKAYTEVQSYQVDALVTNQRRGAPAAKTPSEIVSVAYVAPNRLRLESNNQPEVTVFHDQGISIYSKDMSVYRTAPAAANRRETVNDSRHRRDALEKIGFADYGSIENGMQSARLLLQESLVLDGEPVSCWVVEADYPGGVKRTFWVDSKRSVVLREVESEPQGEHTITVRKLSWNVPLSDTLFELKPPSVATRGDSMVQPVPLMRCQQPEYTEEARLAHLAGSVTMSITIDDDGMPSDIHVVSPLGLGLDESAVACMSQSRYSPAQKDGKPVPMKMNVSLGFQQHWDSDWYLGAAAFHTPDGAARPILVKAKYPGSSPGSGPGSSGDKRSLTVCLHLTIDKDGAPRDIQVASPQDPKLDKEAVTIAGAWRFRPGTKDRQPVDVPATFTLVHGTGNRVASNGRELQ
jgi:TonB family protein